MKHYKLIDQTGEAFKNKQWVITVSNDPNRTDRALCCIPQWIDMSPEQVRTDAEHILAAIVATESDVQLSIENVDNARMEELIRLFIPDQPEGGGNDEIAELRRKLACAEDALIRATQCSPEEIEGIYRLPVPMPVVNQWAGELLRAEYAARDEAEYLREQNAQWEELAKLLIPALPESVRAVAEKRFAAITAAESDK